MCQRRTWVQTKKVSTIDFAKHTYMYGTHQCVFTGILCVDANIELCTTYGEPVKTTVLK